VITLAQAQSQLSAWLEADAAVASGQSYSIGDRQLTRADADKITHKIDYWSQHVARLSRGGIRVFGVTPSDG
jgi:predicted RecB family nuclease